MWNARGRAADGTRDGPGAWVMPGEGATTGILPGLGGGGWPGLSGGGPGLSGRR